MGTRSYPWHLVLTLVALSFVVPDGTIAALAAPESNQVGAPEFLRVRTPTGFARDEVREGYRRSATFRRLVDRLESDRSLLVLIEPGPCAESRYRGCIWALASRGHLRSVVIKIDPVRDTRDRLIAVLGHELQHAVEIADHPTVVDPRTAQEFFGGRAGACDHSAPCETAAAGNVERVIRKELNARPAPPVLIAGK
jgi:hypothetical protein